MQAWSSDALFNKAKHFAKLAFSESRQSPLFPLLASFSLELLGKAALAKVHPSLIADPQDGANILYAFGYPATKRPQTIAAKTVFSRLTLVIDEFRPEDEALCLAIALRRNVEVHTGQFAYEDFSNGKWLPGFYRVSGTLVRFMGLSLADLLGEHEAKIAENSIHNVEKEVGNETAKRIGEARKAFSLLRENEKKSRRQENEPKFEHVGFTNGVYIFAASCPACDSKSELHTLKVGVGTPRLNGTEIQVEEIFSPRKLECKVCDLKLNTVAELRAADMADQITSPATLDPVDHLEIDFSNYSDRIQEYFFEPDYGND